MCIGIPMQVLQTESGRAWCDDGQQARWIDTRLIDEPDAGSWLLVFLDAAREAITAQRAAQVRDALGALAAINSGDLVDLDGFFADLLEREPQLPPHLQAQVRAKEKT
ncbi:HypC/HybG/HupF family hydrogenase formation chaperone [Azomonas macrocytogenes]|uniref:Hydrogenase expression/formation protein HypC n=1 Tax=Azomonas macrocytogenes TaxID=69962 RepID=A0A839T9B7_AZOMA|nr:HypC/HybG/HupF family hydrogenase formation chaperone [Azomonas macrocytogenes]MBB3104814.1 hydrogenase expression/formation protein HypC [Azomonas macrocytogenes]